MTTLPTDDERIAALLGWDGTSVVHWIDVGALIGSVTQRFSDAGGWGINVEPIRARFDALVAARPRDVNLWCGLDDIGGGHDGTLKVIHGSEGLSTFDEKWSGLWGSSGFEGEHYHWETVPMWTLAETYDRCLQSLHLPEGDVIDFLKIDAENLDDRVIAGNDWTHLRPRVLCCEAHEPCSPDLPIWQKYEPTLIAAGYVLADEGPSNRFYILQGAFGA